ncbi:MAG: hypothetical protein IT203_01460 [Fimbriimonadaceae bacterium]|nr:hypothetical protein [Fimbriimonadaceae bacterium]
MKQRIPPDVERLMWLVAESHDQDALRDFERRFPGLKGELETRRRMVNDLKGAKGHSHLESRIPVFTPKAEPASSARRGLWIAGGLAFAALAVASYSLTSYFNEPAPKPPHVEPVVTQPVEPKNDVVYTPPKLDPKPSVTPPNVAVPQESVDQTSDAPKSLRLSNTSLVAALKLIGSNAGYNVEIAPGFEDQTISLDYADTTTTEMLRDLGLRYGFTAFDQGDGTIIVVPAVDSNPHPGEPNGSQRRIG